MPYEEKKTKARGKPGYSGGGPRRDSYMDKLEAKSFPEKARAKAIRKKKKEVDYGGFGDYD